MSGNLLVIRQGKPAKNVNNFVDQILLWLLLKTTAIENISNESVCCAELKENLAWLQRWRGNNTQFQSVMKYENKILLLIAQICFMF